MWFPKAIVFVLLALTIPSQAQQADSQRKHRYVVVPPESSLLVIASQPDCPLKFQNAKLLISADGDGAWGASYELRNQGTKPIKSFTAVLWTSYGTGGTLARPKRIDRELIMPGQTINGDDDEIISLTSELREKLKLQGPMKAVIVMMIENIKFADGSSYNDEVTSEALVNYFADLDSKANRAIRQK